MDAEDRRGWWAAQAGRMRTSVRRLGAWPPPWYLLAGVAALAVMLLCALFWRAVEAMVVLGPRSAIRSLRYIGDSLEQLYLCNGEDLYRQAIARLEATTAQDATVTREKRLLARAYANVGRQEKAERLYRSMLEQRPDDPELLTGLGLLLMRRGEIQNCGGHAGFCIYPLSRAHPKPRDVAESHELFRRALQPHVGDFPREACRSLRRAPPVTHCAADGTPWLGTTSQANRSCISGAWPTFGGSGAAVHRGRGRDAA